MTKIQTIIIILFCSFLFLGSCKEVVQDNFENPIKTPVLNAILEKDSLINVHLSFTGNINDKNIVNIENARILLFEDSVFIEILNHVEGGNYNSTTIAKANKNYQAIIEIPGYETISGVSNMPDTTSISIISIIKNAFFDEEGKGYPSVTFKIKNDETKKKYYQLVIKLFRNDEIRYLDIIGVSDPVLLNEGLPISVFSNEVMQGSWQEISLNIALKKCFNDGCELNPVIIEVRTIDENYYHYIRQLYLFKNAINSITINGQQTPYPLFSNIDNGFGIFAGYSSYQTDTIYLP